MSWYFILLVSYGAVEAILTIIILWNIEEFFIENFDSIYNPLVIYEDFEVNIFGCILLTLLFHILLLPPALFYWLYKLCTVGRK